MASDLEEKAKEAFVEDHFELAVELLSQAITLDPLKPEFYADRAQAHIKLNNFTDAVADANKAIELNPSLSKAYLRKGNACMKLEEYQTAKTALETGASLAADKSRFVKLIEECDELIAEESDTIPTQEKSTTQDPTSKDVQPEDLSEEPIVVVAKPKYRHEFYQKPEEVVVTIFAKGVSKESITVDFGEQILSVNIDVPGEDAYVFQNRLFGKIVPSRCRYEVLTTKIEIRLAKAESIPWKTLEFNKETTIAPKAIASVTATQRPTYPSSKPKRTDWDKLEAQVKKEEKDENLDGDAALNKFFREIYQDADEDTRRAMKKSFVESNGTVLSTNWKEVGTKKVEGSPPDGMELKKWEY
ncbi:putative SGS domain, HSP20-like chaperone, acetyltransferase A, auxiliary subunit [Medicago truncatula]|uniref:Protein SGT1 homolog n=1 Tax=Medicago truncatula TaxID=3880 RepID=A0A072UAF1_MEDTR|nr:protein SGT1 homolog A [Medicago truncatula]KEH26376.1 suppressor of G2 allele of SKP1 protein [Medicago truncatula]RHN51580.1 putative SGS domain, HSP20-like chaperone, acetyltransferase A, auxiliary subunit [Medicago truncatula]